MSVDPKHIRKALRKLVDLLADEAERNPEFAASLSEIFSSLTTQSRSERSPKKPEATSKTDIHKEPKEQVPDPFQAFHTMSLDSFRVWLDGLSIQQLRSIIRQHGLDPSRLSDKWKTKERYVELITERVDARSKQGETFRHYGSKLSSSDSSETTSGVS